MRILEVLPGLSSGGAERFVVDLSNQFASMGCDVSILLMKSVDEKSAFYMNEVSSNVKVSSMNEGKCGLLTFWHVYKAIKAFDVDVIHIHLFSMVFFSMLAILFHGKKRCVVTCHNQCESERDSSTLRWIVKKILYKIGSFDQIAISHQNAESILNVYGKPASAIIYNGRKTLKATHGSMNVVNEVKGYKDGCDTSVFVTIARCSEQKNIPRMVRVFNSLKSKGYDLTLLVIGDGYDNAIGEDCHKMADKHIHFLGQRHNVGDYLRASDFFTLSSDYEGMPITLIEALACGCVPVGTPVSGFTDVIENGVTGYIAEDFSDEAYERSIVEAITNKGKINVKELEDLYDKNFSIEMCAEKYQDFFKLHE